MTFKKFWIETFSENGSASFARVACGYLILFTTAAVGYILVARPDLNGVIGSLLGGMATIIGLVYGAARLGGAAQSYIEKTASPDKK